MFFFCRSLRCVSIFKILNNSRALVVGVDKLIEIKREKLCSGNNLLTVNNQYINDFMKKLTIYITNCANGFGDIVKTNADYKQVQGLYYGSRDSVARRQALKKAGGAFLLSSVASDERRVRVLI